MNIIERARQGRQALVALAPRTVWDWRRCPTCGRTHTQRWGPYVRRPWFLTGRRNLRVQRHKCLDCQRTYSEQSAVLVRGSWYAREVHRCAIDQWQHTGTSLRRTAEWLRSWLGQQERWQAWRPLDPPPVAACALAASTVQRWLDDAGKQAQASITDQLRGIVAARAVGVDGLWAKLTVGVRRVLLAVIDSVTGWVLPLWVAPGEEAASSWQELFARAELAGLDLERLRGVTSDGARGLLAFLRRGLPWILQQRCVWHVWRNLRGPVEALIQQATQGLTSEAAAARRQQVRDELSALIHAVLDAPNHAEAEVALVALAAHPLGATKAKQINEQFDQLLVYLVPYYQGLQRVTPEWVGRDFRLRLGHGRNHGSELRWERAALLWAIYHNFEPTQRRSERKRHYRYPGQSALHVAGASPGQLTYLDALGA